IVSIGIDTWGVDYGLIDRSGRLMGNPVHYRDVRTDNITAEFAKYMSAERLYAITGIQSMDFNTVFQLAAELRDDPERLRAADKLLFIPDLLNYFLTGKMATEYTIASTGALLDAERRAVSEEILSAMGIPTSLFAPVVMPGQRIGRLSSSILEEVGSTDAEVVHVAAHDTASAVIAVPAKDEDFIYISSGTWSLLGAELPAPMITAESRANNFTNEGGVEGTIRFLKNIMGLWLVQESRRQWKREGKDYSFSDLAGLAKEAPALRSIIDPDDKRFATPGDMPRRMAEYCRETGQPVPETEGEIIRCVLESLALCYRATIDKITAMRGKAPTALNIVGGGTQDKQLCQFAANACGIPVYAGPVEATAIGNIAMQAISAGALSSLAEARAVVAASFPLDTYLPDHAAKPQWDEAYALFCRLTAVK
ncbi:MAG: rhamnulokinase, partial [Clostridia bacterium]|nr:rhamnulokinase [Clostridia bacterium]